MRDLKEIQDDIYPPMVEGHHDLASVSDKVGDITLKKRTPFGWFIGFGLPFLLLSCCL